MSELWNMVDLATDALGSHALQFALAMAGIGVLSMAIIQTLKDITPMRACFHRCYLRQWLLIRAVPESRAFRSMRLFGLRDPLHGWQESEESGRNQMLAFRAEQDLIRIATGGDRDAFYDLQLEQLCGQMNAAAQLILSFPAQHKPLLRILAAQADARDVDMVLARAEFKNSPQSDNDHTDGHFQDARNRVGHAIQRSIDALQISAGYRWKFYMQLLSFVASFAIAYVAMTTFDPAQASVTYSEETLRALAIPVGFVAGFLAPVARDLVAGLQQFRK